MGALTHRGWDASTHRGWGALTHRGWGALSHRGWGACGLWLGWQGSVVRASLTQVNDCRTRGVRNTANRWCVRSERVQNKVLARTM